MAGQIARALSAIDRIGYSKYAAKQEQDWRLGEAVAGLFSHGYRNTVLDRAVTFTHWLREQYPTVRLFRDVDHDMTAEFLGEKAETRTPDTIRTLLATLRKLQEELYALNWIREDIVPAECQVIGRNPTRLHIGAGQIEQSNGTQRSVAPPSPVEPRRRMT